jgi:hypothetical protein
MLMPRRRLGAIADVNGQPLAFVYFEPDETNYTPRSIMNRLTCNEVRRIAANIAKLPAFIEAGVVAAFSCVSASFVQCILAIARRCGRRRITTAPPRRTRGLGRDCGRSVNRRRHRGVA